MMEGRETIRETALTLSKVPLDEQLPDGAREMLGYLGKAFKYAQELKTDRWEFALSLESLLRMGVCETDLRWMVLNGHVDRADELTTDCDVTRRFRPRSNCAFTRETRFVLSEKGAMLLGIDTEAVALSAQVANPPEILSIATMLPHWDEDRRVLYFGDEVVKFFRLSAPNQEAILAAFQEENWPYSIDDPLAPVAGVPPKRRLNETIKALNANQSCRLLRFRGKGNGEQVCWEPYRISRGADYQHRRAA